MTEPVTITDKRGQGQRKAPPTREQQLRQVIDTAAGSVARLFEHPELIALEDDEAISKIAAQATIEVANIFAAPAASDDAPKPPPWWGELLAVDAELHSVTEKWGEPSEQGNTFATFGNPMFAAHAAEMKRINDARKAAGRPGRWSTIIQEELFEALEIPHDPENVGAIYGELIQAAAMCLAAAEDLRRHAR